MRRLISRFKKQAVSWHAPLIQKFAEILQPEIYAELGIYEGETFNLIKANYKIAVDINMQSLEFVKGSKNVQKICGDSTALSDFLNVNHLLVDMLFIDADHRKDSVIRDFSSLEMYLSEKAIVLFHDTYPLNEEMASPNYCGDSYLAIPELRTNFKNWNFITFAVHPGLTIATRVNHLPVWTKSSGKTDL